MRRSFVYRLLAAWCLLALCSCSRSDSEEVARLRKELDAAKAEAAAAKTELAQLKSSKKDDPNPAVGRTIVLEGVAEVPIMTGPQPSVLEVFYKTPFATPPALTFPQGLHGGCEVAEQNAGSFKLRRIAREGEVYVKISWKAEGQQAK